MYNLINESAALILILQTELLRGGRQGARSMVRIFTLAWGIFTCHIQQSRVYADNLVTLHTTASCVSNLLPVTSRFLPKTFKLHVRDGDKGGNVGCDPPDALKPLAMSKVKIQLRDTRVAVYVNGEQVCTQGRIDRSVYKKAIVYAADPYVQALV